jgi:N4-gp56 family major capsid protein
MREESEAFPPPEMVSKLCQIAEVTEMDYMTFSDVVDFQQIDPLLTEYSVEQGTQAAETKDTLVRDEIVAGTNVFYAGGRVSRATLAVGDKPTIDMFRKAALSMKKNMVKPAADGKYVALVGPDVIFDLMDDAKFIKAYEIGRNNTPFIEGEVADIYGIKFVEVLNPKIYTGAGAASANVHTSILLGANAYGVTKINGEGDAKVIVKALGSSGVADPLNQRQSIGWKINAFVAKRLEETAIARLESVPSNA